MANLLTPVQTTWNIRNSAEKLENVALKDDNASLLAVASTSRNSLPEDRKNKGQDSSAFLQQVYLNSNESTQSLPDDARKILNSQPDQEDLVAVLQYLQCGIDGKHDFDIRVSSPQASRIVNILATITIPEQWANLNITSFSDEDAKIKQMLLSCLTSVAGLGALHARTRTLAQMATSKTNFSSVSLVLTDTIAVLANVLQGPTFLSRVLHDTVALHSNLSQRHAIWQEMLAFIAGGKILSAVASSLHLTTSESRSNGSNEWLGDGNDYCKWLGMNIAYASTRSTVKDTESWPLIAQVVKRGLGLGYSGALVTEIYSGFLLGPKALWTLLVLLINNLPRPDQRRFFYTMLRCLSNSYLGLLQGDGEICAVAAMVSGLVKENRYLEDCLVEWLTATNGDAVMLSLNARRAAICVLGRQEEQLQAILDRSMRIFSDELHIQHDSVMQQEATAQVILLTVGYLYRMSPKRVSNISKSSHYLHAVSNRLGASLPRARLLGMIVGTVISKLVDAPDKAMNFDFDEMMTTDELESWLKLPETNDRIGSIEVLKLSKVVTKIKPATSTAKPRGQNGTTESRLANKSSKIISIEEIIDDEESDDDLLPYQKPDEDPSDSDEDPTLVNRSKPTAPVYIRDLVKALQLNDKPDVVELALKSAPALIRRKMGFGTELAENIDTLASALINLQEGMSRTETQRLRLHSLIACLIAQPARMGPWLASMYFEGDFSLAQRASILTTIGLGARDLAGYQDDPALKPDKQTSFPSQRLPANLAAIYAPVNDLAEQLEHATLQPMALAAADKISGPDILKVRTFSSRLDVERKTAQKAKQRQTRIPKDIHKLLVESLFLPLCCRMSLLLSSRPNTNATTLFEPHILRLFLQTLTILFTTLGPNALQLHTVTRETLILLTNLHAVTVLSTDAAILPALLQLLLTTLDLNVAAGLVAEENLVTEFGTMVAELVAWAGNLSNVVNVPTAEKSEGMGMAWTVLVAGVQVKWHEVGRKFQGRMVGLTGSEMEGY